MEKWLVVIIWCLSGGYRWSLKLLPSLDALHLKVAWPRSLTAKKVSSTYKEENPGDALLREQAIKEAIAEKMIREGKAIMVDMTISLECVVTEDEPDVSFTEHLGELQELGEQYEGVQNLEVYDRYLIIDMKLPSTSFKKKKQSNVAIFK